MRIIPLCTFQIKYLILSQYHHYANVLKSFGIIRLDIFILQRIVILIHSVGSIFLGTHTLFFLVSYSNAMKFYISCLRLQKHFKLIFIPRALPQNCSTRWFSIVKEVCLSILLIQSNVLFPHRHYNISCKRNHAL